MTKRGRRQWHWHWCLLPRSHPTGGARVDETGVIERQRYKNKGNSLEETGKETTAGGEVVAA